MLAMFALPFHDLFFLFISSWIFSSFSFPSAIPTPPSLRALAISPSGNPVVDLDTGKVNNIQTPTVQRDDRRRGTGDKREVEEERSERGRRARDGGGEEGESGVTDDMSAAATGTPRPSSVQATTCRTKLGGGGGGRWTRGSNVGGRGGSETLSNVV